jgi:translation initiation factor 3 subunit I
VTIFDCETGAVLNKLTTGAAINKACGFSLSGNMVMACRRPARGEKSRMFVFDIRDGAQMRESPTPSFAVDLSQTDSTNDECSVAAWAGLDNQVLVGMANGDLQMWDIRSGQARPEPVVNRKRAHDASISDLQLSRDQSMVVTCAPDGTAKLWDAFQLEPFKTFKADRPLNSIAISPTKPHILTGGGQLARDVALTGGMGQFEALFYHLVFEDMFAKVKDHFGPIRSLAFQPDGTGYASGAHDGMIFLHKFDASYDKYEIEY